MPSRHAGHRTVGDHLHVGVFDRRYWTILDVMADAAGGEMG